MLQDYFDQLMKSVKKPTNGHYLEIEILHKISRQYLDSRNFWVIIREYNDEDFRLSKEQELEFFRELDKKSPGNFSIIRINTPYIVDSFDESLAKYLNSRDIKTESFGHSYVTETTLELYQKFFENSKNLGKLYFECKPKDWNSFSKKFVEIFSHQKSISFIDLNSSVTSMQDEKPVENMIISYLLNNENVRFLSHNSDPSIPSEKLIAAKSFKALMTLIKSTFGSNLSIKFNDKGLTPFELNKEQEEELFKELKLRDFRSISVDSTKPTQKFDKSLAKYLTQRDILESLSHNHIDNSSLQVYSDYLQNSKNLKTLNMHCISDSLNLPDFRKTLLKTLGNQKSIKELTLNSSSKLLELDSALQEAIKEILKTNNCLESVNNQQLNPKVVTEATVKEKEALLKAVSKYFSEHQNDSELAQKLINILNPFATLDKDKSTSTDPETTVIGELMGFDGH